MFTTNIEIDTKVNELYAKTIVTQKIINNLLFCPLELKIYLNKNYNCLFSSFSAKIGDSILVQSKVIKKEKPKLNILIVFQREMLPYL